MKVRIYQPHTHAGTRYVPGPEGLEVELSESAVAWLKEHNPEVLAKPDTNSNAPAPKA